MRSDLAFVQSFLNCLDEQNIEYCVLRNANEILCGDAHDIDMTVDFERIDDVYKAINRVAEDKWKIHLFTEKDNGNLVSINLYTVENREPILLHFDLFKSFGWHGFKLLNYKTLYTGREKKGEIYEASPSIQAVTMLFSRYLYHGYIRIKYRSFIVEQYKKKPDLVKTLMHEFMPKEFVDSIYYDVVREDWNNIEQEWPVVKKAVESCCQKQQPNIKWETGKFNIKRLTKVLGAVICLPMEKNIEKKEVYVSDIQRLLSKTFAEADIIKKFSGCVRGGGGGRSFVSRLGKHKLLSQGKLIFTDSPGKDAIIISDINLISPAISAIQILDSLSKRYSK